jgi:hypothetical protein
LVELLHNSGNCIFHRKLSLFVWIISLRVQQTIFKTFDSIFRPSFLMLHFNLDLERPVLVTFSSISVSILVQFLFYTDIMTLMSILWHQLSAKLLF